VCENWEVYIVKLNYFNSGSLEDNLKMSSKKGNILLSSLAVKYTFVDIVVFNYIPFPVFLFFSLFTSRPISTLSTKKACVFFIVLSLTPDRLILSA